MDYNLIKKRNILYCILDNIENQSSTFSKEIAMNISDYFLSLLLRRDYDIIIDDSSDKLLARASSDEFYTHAVVVITGTHTELNEGLFKAVEQKCQEDFFVAGHILDRSDSYYEIHNQFFIVNLKEYRKLGSPVMGDTEWNTSHVRVEPIRSEECINNDKEIPVWIKYGTTEKTYKHKRHGWNLFETGLKNNAVMCDLGPKIRNSKKYLYYEYDHVFLRHMPELFNYSITCTNMVTPWNSDTLPYNIRTEEGFVDHYVSIGTGLNWLYNLTKLGYTPNTKVTFTDISYSVLSFMKALVTEWDGEDYASFYMEQLQFIPKSYKLNLPMHESRIREWFNEFQKEFTDFKETWNTMKQLKFDFVLMDFFAPLDLSFISHDEVTFMSVSDAFNHVPYIHYAPLKFRLARENNLIKTLQQINPNAYLLIPVRLGMIYKETKTLENNINFDRVKNFKLDDINEFKTPPWQASNWRSYCPLSGDVRIVS